MMSNAKIGVALVGGYVLGRTKKAKLAIGLGMYLAGKRLPLDPKQLGKLVANSPVLGPLNDQVRSELVDATKSAVSTALNQRMSALTDSLHERTLELSDAESESRTGRDAETADEPAHVERLNSGTKSAKSPTKKAIHGTSKTASGARKTTSGARKTTSGTRKTATGTRKKASGAPRRTADRGGPQ
ncbi:hypothetical protein AB0B07_01970 [Streptomyces sioyaensis]|uniref:hypothetical protein n=1 Tax=Streptomyces sioyaensis TaxID=67364 RepID=UPI0033C20A32